MTMRMLRIRMLASKQCIAIATNKSPEALANEEAMQAAAIIHEVRRSEDLITEDDRGKLVELARAIGLSTQYFMPILDAFANLKVKGNRRRGQLHHHHRHHHHHHRHHHRLDQWQAIALPFVVQYVANTRCLDSYT